MDESKRFSVASLLVILCAILDLILGLVALFANHPWPLMVWAGAVAGFIAILHAGNLESISAALRRSLFIVGALAMLVMATMALVIH